MNKKSIPYFVTMFICFVIDSTITYFLPFDFTKSGLMLVPCIGLMMFVLLSNCIDKEIRYFFASVVGIYYAVIYANSLAIYVLLYCIYAFFVKIYMKSSSFTYLESLLVFVLTIFAQEVVLYWLMWITNITELSVFNFAILRLLPTLGLNIVLSIPLFVIYKKLKFEGRTNVY